MTAEVTPDPYWTTYAAWVQHVKPDEGKPCTTCGERENPTEGCDEGKRLWGKFRLIKISRSIPIRDGS